VCFVEGAGSAEANGYYLDSGRTTRDGRRRFATLTHHTFTSVDCQQGALRASGVHLQGVALGARTRALTHHSPNLPCTHFPYCTPGGTRRTPRATQPSCLSSGMTADGGLPIARPKHTTCRCCPLLSKLAALPGNCTTVLFERSEDAACTACCWMQRASAFSFLRFPWLSLIAFVCSRSSYTITLPFRLSTPSHSFTSTALTLPLAPRLTVTNPSSPAMFYRPPSRHRGSQQSRQRQDSAKHRHRAFASCHPFRPRQSTRLHRKRTLLPLRAAFSLNSHMHPLRKRPRQLLALLLLLKEMAQRQSLCKRGHLSNSRVEGAHHHRHPSG
jgi:hypothetical protein